jgi:hypothetical protein
MATGRTFVVFNDSKIEIASSSPIKFKIGAEVIKWYQGTKYSHVLIIIGDLVFQASHGYVNVWHIDNFLKENIIFDRITVKKELIDFDYMFSQLGKHYGFSQVIEIVIKFVFVAKIKLINSIRFNKIFKDNGNEKLICSEYVGKVLRLSWVNDDTDPKEIIDYLKSKTLHINFLIKTSKDSKN